MTRGACALLVLLAACGGGTAAPVRVTEAWLRAPPGGLRDTAAYLTLENRSPDPRTLTGVTSPQFARVEPHETSLDGGIARMRPRASLTLAPHQRAALEPGGMHLMLHDAARVPGAGDSVRLRLHFEDGATIDVDAEVRSP